MKVPIAANCSVVPEGMLGIAGVTAIETNAAGVTVSVVVPTIEPEVAETVVPPIAMLLASPWALTVATAESPVLQVTFAVRS